MHRIFVFSSVIALAASAALAQDQSYDVTGFDRVDVGAGVEVDVSVGGDFAVTGTAERGDIANLEISRRGETLMITRDTDDGWPGWSILDLLDSDDRFYVMVSLPNLVAISSASGSNVTVTGATVALSDVSSASGSSLDVRDATLGQVKAEASSGSSLRLVGSCDRLRADASSGADLDADQLECTSVDITASSGSSLSAYASDTAEVDGSSGASMRITGGAAITAQSISSGASLRSN